MQKGKEKPFEAEEIEKMVGIAEKKFKEMYPKIVKEK